MRDEDFVESFEGWIKNTPLPFDTEPLIFPPIRNQDRGGCSWKGGFFDKSLSLVASLMDLHLYNPEARPTRREVSNENLNVPPNREFCLPIIRLRRGERNDRR